jgi:hypothetical protein
MPLSQVTSKWINEYVLERKQKDTNKLIVNLDVSALNNCEEERIRGELPLK